jgi:hypothetical protein
MNKIQKPSVSECYTSTPSLELFILMKIYLPPEVCNADEVPLFLDSFPKRLMLSAEETSSLGFNAAKEIF